MKRWLSLLAFTVLLVGCGTPATAANTPVATASLASTETPTPTPAPIEVAPGEFLPASQVIGYEARSSVGALLYIQDIHGNWIRASYEAKPPIPDWTGLNTRLESVLKVMLRAILACVEYWQYKPYSRWIM